MEGNAKTGTLRRFKNTIHNGTSEFNVRDPDLFNTGVDTAPKQLSETFPQTFKRTGCAKWTQFWGMKDYQTVRKERKATADY